MNVFIVDLKHMPGELAKATEVIARKGVNITAFSGTTCGGSGQIALVTDDNVEARHALTEAGYLARELELVPVTLSNSPGALAKVARKLGDAGISIEAALPIEMDDKKVTIGFAVDQPSKAKGILGVTDPIGAAFR
jgi:hypothetical protein